MKTWTEEATAYAKRMRNPAKRDYALRYIAWLAAGGTNDGRTPEPRYAPGLSAMAAQAVRIKVYFYEGKKS
jgi:hypothetical protein